MSIFKTWKKQKLVISDVDPVYKVKYLGNVQTALMKGEGCVDKPTAVLWNNFVKNGQTVGLDMSLTICGTGMKAITKEQGLTEYRAHRISYCIAHPKYPKLFVWVYRHEGKKMKVELRCHAVLCKSEPKAKLMAVQLHEKLSFALSEFLRDKTRRQNTRIALQRTNSSPSSESGISGVSLRNKFKNTADYFKPPADTTSGSAKLGAISEDCEEEEEEEEEEEAEDLQELQDEDVLVEDLGPGPVLMNTHPSMTSLDLAHRNGASGSTDDNVSDGEIANGMIQLEVGNDIEQLKEELQREPYDSDAESSESGFSEQGDSKENGSSGSVSTGNGSYGSNSYCKDSAQNGTHLTGNFSNNNSLSSTGAPLKSHVAIQSVTANDSDNEVCISSL